MLGGAGVDPQPPWLSAKKAPTAKTQPSVYAGGDLPLAADAAAGDVATLLDRARAAGRGLHAATLPLWRAYQAL